MGGYGSGRWRSYRSKATVEENLSLDLAKLHESGWLKRDLLKQRVIAQGKLSWSNVRTQEPSGNIMVHVDTTTDNPHLRLEYTTTRDNQVIARTNEIVRISYAEQPYGGKRVWLHCPQCDKRVRAIHCPPNGLRFLCRDCHDLSYISVQEAHRDDRGMFAGVGMEWRIEEKKAALYKKLWKTRLYRGNPSKAQIRIKAKLKAIDQGRIRYRIMAHEALQKRFGNVV